MRPRINSIGVSGSAYGGGADISGLNLNSTNYGAEVGGEYGQNMNDTALH